MLLHNIGKIQHYNEMIDSYPSFLFIEQRAVFVMASAAEVLLSLLIIVGVWVRAAALWMAAGISMLLAWNGAGDDELRLAWLGIYLFLAVSGGGAYAYEDKVSTPKIEN